MIKNVVDGAFEYSKILPRVGLLLACCGVAAAYTIRCILSIIDLVAWTSECIHER